MDLTCLTEFQITNTYLKLPDQDSNLGRQDQNLLCCRYTIGQKTSLKERAAKVVYF